MVSARLPRKDTVLWNVIPGWNGTRKIGSEERNEGLIELSDLLPLLQSLRTVVLVGQKAQAAKAMIVGYGLRTISSAHPSPLVKASQPRVWNGIATIWASAAAFAG